MIFATVSNCCPSRVPGKMVLTLADEIALFSACEKPTPRLKLAFAAVTSFKPLSKVINCCTACRRGAPFAPSKSDAPPTGTVDAYVDTPVQNRPHPLVEVMGEKVALAFAPAI